MSIVKLYKRFAEKIVEIGHSAEKGGRNACGGRAALSSKCTKPPPATLEVAYSPVLLRQWFSLSHATLWLLLTIFAIPQYDTGLVRFVWQKPIARERHWHWDGVDRLDPSRAVGAVAPLLTPPWRNKPYAYPRYGLPDRSRQADGQERTLADWSARHTQERT